MKTCIINHPDSWCLHNYHSWGFRRWLKRTHKWFLRNKWMLCCLLKKKHQIMRTKYTWPQISLKQNTTIYISIGCLASNKILERLGHFLGQILGLWNLDHYGYMPCATMVSVPILYINAQKSNQSIKSLQDWRQTTQDYLLWCPSL